MRLSIILPSRNSDLNIPVNGHGKTENKSDTNTKTSTKRKRYVELKDFAADQRRTVLPMLVSDPVLTSLFLWGDSEADENGPSCSDLCPLPSDRAALLIRPLLLKHGTLNEGRSHGLKKLPPLDFQCITISHQTHEHVQITASCSEMDSTVKCTRPNCPKGSVNALPSFCPVPHRGKKRIQGCQQAV